MKISAIMCVYVFMALNLNINESNFFSCIVYYMVGLNPLRFGQFIGIVGFTALTAISLGMHEKYQE